MVYIDAVLDVADYPLLPGEIWMVSSIGVISFAKTLLATSAHISYKVDSLEIQPTILSRVISTATNIILIILSLVDHVYLSLLLANDRLLK